MTNSESIVAVVKEVVAVVLVAQAAGEALGASHLHPGNPAGFLDNKRRDNSQCYLI